VKVIQTARLILTDSFRLAMADPGDEPCQASLFGLFTHRQLHSTAIVPSQ